MADTARLIVVDDEPDLRGMIAEYLGKQGFIVGTAANGHELDAHMASGSPDLLILDVNLPGEDGFAIARRVRACSAVPILMLTAADDIVDRVVGLEMGADDYLTKPFDLRELRARIRAILRRTGPPITLKPAGMAGTVQAPEPRCDAASKLRFGRLWLDLDARRLIDPNGTELALTATEFGLLAAFARNPNRVLSRERLLDLAHDHASDGCTLDAA